MLRLSEITEDNMLDVFGLSVREDQKGYVSSPVGIVARGYVYRAQRPRVFAICDDETVVGAALIKDMDEEPACYDLQQFLIDQRYQGRGFGSEALRQILAILKAERKYDCVEVCVKQEDTCALHVYEKAGFYDTGYIDETVPDCLNLMCDL
jgi:RimJ/RimL family protein N-acetyltransferase